MSTIFEKGLEKALKKYLMTLEPMAKNVPKKASASTNSDGSVAIKQEKGDMYLDKQQASAFSKAIAKAIKEHVGPLLSPDALSWNYLGAVLPSGVTSPITCLYQFDETSDYLKDRSSAGRDLVKSGTEPAKAAIDGFVGRTFFDDGSGHLLETAVDSALAAATGALTFEMLVAMQGTTADQDSLFSISGDPSSETEDNNFLFDIRAMETPGPASNKLTVFHEYGGGFNVITDPNVCHTVGVLHHLAVTKAADGITHNFYNNALHLGSKVSTNAATVGSSPNITIKVGGYNIASTPDAIIFGARLVLGAEFTAAQVLESHKRVRGLIT